MPRVALVQLTSGPEVGPNLETLGTHLETLRREHDPVDMIFTPENALVLGATTDYQRAAEPLEEGPTQIQVAQLAREHGLWLSLGSFPIREASGKLKATTLVYDNQGVLQAYYQKIHLFDVEVPGDRDGRAYSYRESDIFSEGHQEVLADTPVGKLGLSICYDLRFPALYTRLRELGAEALAIPAAFTQVTGQAHWEILLRARAIETQCYVLAPAQEGLHPDGRYTWGHSMVVDPWGRILAAAGAKESLLVTELDLQEIEQVRTRMPLAAHARFQANLKLL
jgi:predicted amidohydrolase